MNTMKMLRLSGIALLMAASVAGAQPTEPIRPTSPVTRPVPDSRAMAADLKVESFTLTMPSATVVDRGRNRMSTPIELVVRNQGVGNAARFSVIFTISRRDGTIIWSGSAQELSGAALDAAGNTCTDEGLAAGAQRVLTGTLTATVSRRLALLPGLPVAITATVNPPFVKEFGPECGRIAETSTANNSATQRTTLPR